MHDHMRSKFAQRRFDAYVPFDGRGDWRGLVLQRNDDGGHVLLLRGREGGREGDCRAKSYDGVLSCKVKWCGSGTNTERLGEGVGVFIVKIT